MNGKLLTESAPHARLPWQAPTSFGPNLEAQIGAFVARLLRLACASPGGALGIARIEGAAVTNRGYALLALTGMAIFSRLQRYLHLAWMTCP